MVVITGRDDTQRKTDSPSVYIALSLFPTIRLRMNRDLTKIDGDKIDWHNLAAEAHHAQCFFVCGGVGGVALKTVEAVAFFSGQRPR